MTTEGGKPRHVRVNWTNVAIVSSCAGFWLLLTAIFLHSRPLGFIGIGVEVPSLLALLAMVIG